MNTQHPTSNIQHRTRGALRSVLGALAVGLVLSSVAQPANTNSAAPAASVSSVPTFDLFNVIQRKNIFDPNRRPWFNTPQLTNRQIDAFALKGTMSYSKGRFAFFDGTNPDYNKVVEVGGTIAGYKVMEITQDSVMLSASGKEFRMPVGRQVRKQNGNWQMGQPIETSNDETNGDETAGSADSSALPPAANAQMSEVLQRLMKAKEQELKDLK